MNQDQIGYQEQYFSTSSSYCNALCSSHELSSTNKLVIIVNKPSGARLSRGTGEAKRFLEHGVGGGSSSGHPHPAARNRARFLSFTVQLQWLHLRLVQVMRVHQRE